MTAAGESRPLLQAEALLSVLEDHQVEYVVIGGFAAQVHGASRPTYDIDVTANTTADNLGRLAQALAELRARVRTESVEGGLPFSASADSLRGVRMLNLTTPLGELDLTFEPAGVGGYDNWTPNAQTYTVGQLQVRIAALADIIRSKTAAGREKDIDALPELHALVVPAGREAGSRDPDGSLGDRP